MTARCPRCSNEVGVRKDGTLYNHRGQGELFCKGAGTYPTVILTGTSSEHAERYPYSKDRP
jgi:hypothetical protein